MSHGDGEDSAPWYRGEGGPRMIAMLLKPLDGSDGDVSE